MFAYIKGQLTETGPDGIVVENGGIGYAISVPGSLLDQMPPLGSDIRVYTCFYVKDDSAALYGFFTKEDLRIFRLLLGVSGIGPKGALSVLSAMSPDDLRFAVLSGDVKAISRAQGIGTKTAQRVILELKDKLDLVNPFETEGSYQETGTGGEDLRNEAVQALMELQFTPGEAAGAVRAVGNTEGMSVEDILQAALKNIVR